MNQQKTEEETAVEINKRMQQFEESLSGGHKLNKWHFLYKDTDNGPEKEAVLFFMDAEYDLCRITYDWSGFLNIHSDAGKWKSLSHGRLLWLAEKLVEVDELVQDWYAGKRNRVRKAWGNPDLEDDG